MSDMAAGKNMLGRMTVKWRQWLLGTAAKCILPFVLKQWDTRRNRTTGISFRGCGVFSSFHIYKMACLGWKNMALHVDLDIPYCSFSFKDGSTRAPHSPSSKYSTLASSSTVPP